MHEDHDVNEHDSHLALLHAHLRARLDRPRRIEPLAIRTFEQLHTVERCELAREPLHRLLHTAIGVLRETASHEAHCRDSALETRAIETRAEAGESDPAVRDTALHQHLKRVLLELPPMHATLLLAHKRDGLSREQMCERFALDAYLIRTYLSQAHALVRILEWEPGDPPARAMHSSAERTLLTAQQAADWLQRLPTAPHNERDEFVDWLRQRVPHVREILLALTWDKALYHLDRAGSSTLV